MSNASDKTCCSHKTEVHRGKEIMLLYSADIVYMYNSVYPNALHTVRGDCSLCHCMSYEKVEQCQKRGALHNVDL